MQGRSLLFIFIFIIAYHGIYAQQLGFRINNNAKKIKIPFELHNNLIVIPVIVNKKLPLKFVLDTGVRTAILMDKDYSDLLNMHYSKKYTLAGVGNKNEIDAYITNNVSLTLPGIHGEGHALLVLEQDFLELSNYLGTEVHGILGYELFSRFVVEINYARQVLTISVDENFTANRRYNAIPMTIEDTKPYIHVKLHQDDGTEVVAKLMVDSGSSQSFFIEYESGTPNLKMPEKTIYSNVGRGLGGPIKGFVGRLPAVEIGEYVLEDVIANYPEDGSYIDSVKYQQTDRDGTIGGEVLSRFNVIFDFPGGTFYIKKNGNFREPFTYNLSGLTIKATGMELDTFEIAEVRENSAGEEAGIMEGDIILELNGYPCNDLDFNNVIAILNSSPNKRVRVKLKRKKELITTSFRLRNLI